MISSFIWIVLCVLGAQVREQPEGPLQEVLWPAQACGRPAVWTVREGQSQSVPLSQGLSGKSWDVSPCFRHAHYGSQFCQSRLKAWVVEQISSSIKTILSLPFEDDTAKPPSPACKLGDVFPEAERVLSYSTHTFWPAASARNVRCLAKVKRTVCGPDTGTQQTGWGRKWHCDLLSQPGSSNPRGEAKTGREKRTLGGNVI